LEGEQSFLDIRIIFWKDAFFSEEQYFLDMRQFLRSGYNFLDSRTFFWRIAHFYVAAQNNLRYIQFSVRAQFFGTAQYFGRCIKYCGYAHNLFGRQHNFLEANKFICILAQFFWDEHKIF
jgi:hypothetical protein